MRDPDGWTAEEEVDYWVDKKGIVQAIAQQYPEFSNDHLIWIHSSLLADAEAALQKRLIELVKESDNV